MEEQTPDEKELWTALEEVIRRAAGQFVESRTQEGAHLRQDILEKLKTMDKKVDLVEQRSPEILGNTGEAGRQSEGASGRYPDRREPDRSRGDPFCR